MLPLAKLLQRPLVHSSRRWPHRLPRPMGNTAGVAVHNPTLNVNPSHTNVTNTYTSVTVNINGVSEDRVAVMAGAASGAALGAALGETA